jgi:uncharacterized protein YndB with AHSA1/START domain
MNAFTSSRQWPVAPSAVFAAIQDPARLARWWGPDGFSNEFKSFDFVPGGQWVFNMIGPDGTVYPNECAFAHIETNRLVAIRHTCAPFFTLTLTMSPTPEGCLLHWEQAFDDAAVAQAIRHIVEPANEQNLDRLEVELGIG